MSPDTALSSLLWLGMSGGHSYKSTWSSCMTKLQRQSDPLRMALPGVQSTENRSYEDGI